MMMSRLGINAEEYFEADDFRDVTNFNTQDTLNALGIATSDIAEMGLSEISKTVMALDRENCIIDEQRQFDYNKDNKDERSQNDERNHIHDGGRLQSSEPDIASAVGSNTRQMVEDEENLSERTSQNPVLQSFDERDAYSALVGSTAESDRLGGELSQANDNESRSDGANESERYDEMGSLNEQHQEFGTGNREGTDNPGELVGNGRRKTVIISPSEASREVALWVGIYKEYLLAESCKSNTQIDRCGRFACAAFLIADSNGFTVWHFAFPPSY